MRLPKGYKKYKLVYKKGGKKVTESTIGTNPKQVKDWFHRVSGTGRYKKRTDIPGFKSMRGGKLISITIKKKRKKKKK